jgi:O-antigen ligase
LLVLAGRRLTRLAGLGLWATGLALFVPFLIPSGRSALFAAAAVVAAGLAVVLALLFRRLPWALAFLVVAAVPARLPVTMGDESANLLVPLYVVVAGAALALGWSLWRDPEQRRELGPLSWPLALFVCWLGLSALWTGDPKTGAIELFFFILPFAFLALALARLPWSERALRLLCGLLGAMAALFAVVGMWQWLTRDVFWNPKVINENAHAPFFRVNSLFWDPSIYGRFLVLTILVALVLLLFAPSRRRDIALGLAIVGLWVALLFTFSQSSFAALIAGVALAAAFAWRRRTAAVVGVVAALMISAGVAAPELADARTEVVAAPKSQLDRATRGRFELVWNGLRIAASHPVGGVGVGGFEQAYLDRFQPPPGLKNPASHTTPVTVVAETGIIGLLLFSWLVAAAAVVAFVRPSRGPRAVVVAGLVAGVGLVAIFVHSLFYAAFLEDPMPWGLFAVSALAARTAAVSRWPTREKTSRSSCPAVPVPGRPSSS